MTPEEIVHELDKHIVGQDAAKRAVAIALRNRWRRQQVPEPLRQEITPKNILMIGPTGVGKTEIARRLARLSGSPFVKVEASKYTEVGYVGRDVESMVRDLVEAAVDMVRREKQAEVREKAEQNVEEQLLDLLLPPARPAAPAFGFAEQAEESAASAREATSATREKLREQLRAGALDQRTVEVEVREKSFPSFQILSNQGVEEMDVNLKDVLPGLFGGRTRRRRLPVPEAREVLLQRAGAASTFSLMPPTGSTRPESVISPVMATRGRTGLPVSWDTTAVVSVTPAEGPSLGMAPSGTCRCRSTRSKNDSSMPSWRACARTHDSAACALSFITSPSWPVRVRPFWPHICVASM